jgi:hypothetical protein
MRIFAAIATMFLLSLGLAGPSRAGLLELPFDTITRHHDCSVEPCGDNGLSYKQVWVRDRYLRYDIHTTPARYAMRRTRVMVSPPVIVTTGGSQWVWDHWGHRSLVAYPTGAATVVRPAQYEWVTQQVLVHPAQAGVTRRQPHYAYYPDTIVVSGQ